MIVKESYKKYQNSMSIFYLWLKTKKNINVIKSY